MPGESAEGPTVPGPGGGLRAAAHLIYPGRRPGPTRRASVPPAWAAGSFASPTC